MWNLINLNINKNEKFILLLFYYICHMKPVYSSFTFSFIFYQSLLMSQEKEKFQKFVSRKWSIDGKVEGYANKKYVFTHTRSENLFKFIWKWLDKDIEMIKYKINSTIFINFFNRFSYTFLKIFETSTLVETVKALSSVTNIIINIILGIFNILIINY